MTFSEVKDKMREFNRKHDIERKVCVRTKKDGTFIEMTARVVLSNSCLNKEYSLEERTYEFTNYNKALTPNDIGYSIFAFNRYDDDCMRIENLTDNDIESAEIISVVE